MEWSKYQFLYGHKAQNLKIYRLTLLQKNCLGVCKKKQCILTAVIQNVFFGARQITHFLIHIIIKFDLSIFSKAFSIRYKVNADAHYVLVK